VRARRQIVYPGMFPDFVPSEAPCGETTDVYGIVHSIFRLVNVFLSHRIRHGPIRDAIRFQDKQDTCARLPVQYRAHFHPNLLVL